MYLSTPRLFKQWLVIAIFLGITSSSLFATELVRETISFDKAWKFQKSDAEGAENLKFNDKKWRLLDVPHDWSIETEINRDNPSGRGGGYFGTGIGWYRKTFETPKSYTGKKVFIQFDGVMANSDVWINGQHLGHRPNGYIGFEYELTPYLKLGKKNVISVKCDNTDQPASRWYTGAGIYRHTRLVVKDPIFIQQWGSFFSSPSVSAEKATVKVKTTVVNSSSVEKEIEVIASIISADGAQKAEGKKSVTLAAGATVDVEQDIVVENPTLWSLENPYLYKGKTQLQVADAIVDDEVVNFGIRSIRFDAATGFYLNDKNFKIKGVCLHHDGAAVGAAVPLAIWHERLLKLKSIGINGVRTAHNPFDPGFYDLCDQLGFLVMNETFDTWRAKKNHADFGYQLYFDKWWEKDTRDIVVRDRNHPSIVIYSVGNEIRDNLSKQSGVDTYKMQHDVVHKYDGTRPVTLALFRPNSFGVYDNGFVELQDVVGQNYREDELVAAHNQKPTRKVIGTENGHLRQAMLTMRDNPFMAGQFLWTGFDYLGEATWPEISHDYGVFDRCGFPKTRTYERAGWWSDKPVVNIVRREFHLGEGELVDDWTPKDFDTYDEAHLEIYTNCDEVELFLNDKSLGVKTNPLDGSAIKWQLTYQQGTIKAVGKNSGKVVTECSYTSAGSATTLKLTATKMKLKNDFDDVVIITTEAVDEEGTRSPNTDKLISFEVSEAGKLIGVDNGDLENHDAFFLNTRRLVKGRCIAIVRAAADQGKITVSASAPGLKSTSIELDIE